MAMCGKNMATITGYNRRLLSSCQNMFSLWKSMIQGGEGISDLCVEKFFYIIITLEKKKKDYLLKVKAKWQSYCPPKEPKDLTLVFITHKQLHLHPPLLLLQLLHHHLVFHSYLHLLFLSTRLSHHHYNRCCNNFNGSCIT